MIGIPAARKPPNTSTITSRLTGSAISSPRTRSFSTWPVMASNSRVPPPTWPVAPGTRPVISAESAASRSWTAVSEESATSAGRSGSSVTDTRNPFPSFAISAAPAGVRGPPGTASGSTTWATPGIARRSVRAAASGSASTGSVAATPFSMRLTEGPVVLAALRISRPVVDSLETVASPAFSRANRPSPKAPVAAANPAMVRTIHTSTISPGRAAMARPSARSTR